MKCKLFTFAFAIVLLSSVAFAQEVESNQTVESHIKNLAAGAGLTTSNLYVITGPTGFSTFRTAAAGSATCDVQTLNNPVAVGKPVIGNVTWSGLTAPPQLFVNGRILELFNTSGITTWSYVPIEIGIGQGVMLLGAEGCQGVVGSFPVTGALEVTLTVNGQKNISVPYGSEVILEWEILKLPKFVSNHLRNQVVIGSTFEADTVSGKKAVKVLADGMHTIIGSLYGQFGFDSVEIKVAPARKNTWRK